MNEETGDQSKFIQNGVSMLERYERKLLDVCVMMLKAGESKGYSPDLYIAAVINRSVNLLKGIRSHVEDRNIICAAPLVRIHLDSIIRLYAMTLVNDKNDFLIRVMNGERIPNIKDRDGKPMHDGYLVDKVSSLDPSLTTLKELYEKTSGFVHFSSVHLLIIGKPQPGGLLLSIGGQGHTPGQAYVEVISAVHDINNLLLAFIRDWINEKDPGNQVELVVTGRVDGGQQG